MTMTFKKAIDDVTNNDVVLSVACKIAETLQVPYSRVTDAYGGYCNNPSKTLPAKAATTTTAATTTAANNTTAAAKTRVLNATANKTATTPAKTSWAVDMFVQPDPFADKVDNAATTKSLKDTAVATAISGVTSAKFGAATVTATVSAEAAVKFVKAPTATGGAKMVTITGSVDVGSYVYCAIAKTASRLRMLNATANATANTTTAATTTTTAAKTTEAITSLQGAAAAAKYKIER